MNPLIPQTAEFLTIGAAWGMTWLGCFGILKGGLSNVDLTRLVSLIFAIAGSFVAAFILFKLYNEYSAGTPQEKEALTSSFTGKNFVSNGGMLLIKLSPIALLYKGFRGSKMVTGIVGLCYVILPYYSLIVSKIVS